MDQKLEDGCVQLVVPGSVSGRNPVRLHGRRLLLQVAHCVETHSAECLSGVGEQLAPRLWLETTTGSDSTDTTEFSFTCSPIMLASTTELHTKYGWLKCLPNTEYALWRKVGLCDVAPLVIHLDDVVWNVIASRNARVVEGDAVPEMTLEDDTEPTFRLYLEAHRDGGPLLREVQEAISRGEDDLRSHREFLFKVFHIIHMPPTLSHDLSKTKLVNFALGRCFSSNDLQVLQAAINFEDCMALVKYLHLEVENHHPEHGARPALSILDMYLDRVSRGVQKTHGWSNKAWCIPERFAPPAYKDDFAALQAQYGHLKLTDPGMIQFPTLLSGAEIAVR